MPTPWVTLSTITGWPNRSVSLLPSIRATVSGLPPGAVGMMIRSGRAGQFPVCAMARAAAPKAATPSSNVLRVSDICPAPPDAVSFCFAQRRETLLRRICGIVAHRRASVQPARDHCSNGELGRILGPGRQRLLGLANTRQPNEPTGQETPDHEFPCPHVRRRRRPAAAAVQSAAARAFRAVADRSRNGAPLLCRRARIPSHRHNRARRRAGGGVHLARDRSPFARRHSRLDRRGRPQGALRERRAGRTRSRSRSARSKRSPTPTSISRSGR